MRDYSMKTFTFIYDEKAVCVVCGKNDGIQYNLTAFAGSGMVYLNDTFGSGEIGIWCFNCDCEVGLTTRCEFEQERGAA